MADQAGIHGEARSLAWRRTVFGSVGWAFLPVDSYREQSPEGLRPSAYRDYLDANLGVCSENVKCVRNDAVSSLTDSQSVDKTMSLIVSGILDVSRLLVGTMLIATQILTGSGYGRALCLRSDGSVCCVHAIAEECSCCEHGHGQQECGHEHDDDCQLVCCIAGNDQPDCDDEPDGLNTSGPEFPLTSELPCGCRHLPITSGPASTTQKSEQVKSTPKASASEHGIVQDQIHQSMRCEPLVVGCNPHWSPHCLSVGLTIVSSTVIRC